MNFVEKCSMEPHACAVFPTLGSAHPKGYIDTRVDLPGPGIHVHRMYISIEAVEQLAIRQGWTSPSERADLQAQVDQLDAEKADLEYRLDTAETIIDSIDVIESAEFKARRRPGRVKVKEPLGA